MKEEFDQRFNCARAHRHRHNAELREATKFLFNGREREWDRTTPRDWEPEEIFDTEAAEMNEEFAADLFQFMTPETHPWVEFRITSAVPEEAEDVIDEIVDEHAGSIEDALSDSNYYHEGPVAFQNAGLGVIALWAERFNPSKPIQFEAIPLSECYFSIGVNGLEDRFRCKDYFVRDLPIVFDDLAPRFSRELRDKVKKGKGTAKVIQGYWRDYTDIGNPKWVRMVKIDAQYFDKEEIGPEGACPFLAGRFNAQPNIAWGRGPGVKMLPKIRVLDTIQEMILEGLDRNLDPAFTYPSDGMLDLSDGIQSGMAYPKMPGENSSVDPIGIVDNLEYGFFSEEMLREVISRGFYRPESQKGKTPPSASQYLGEEQKHIRRMAKPAGKVWEELVSGVIRRVEFLEHEAGRLQYPAINEDMISLSPVSPIQRAQAREEVVTAQGIGAMAREMMGDQAQIVINGIKTLRNIKRKLGDTIIEVNSEEELMQAMQAMNGQAGNPPPPQGPQ